MPVECGDGPDSRHESKLYSQVVHKWTFINYIQPFEKIKSAHTYCQSSLGY